MSAPRTLTPRVLFNLINNCFSSLGLTAVQSDHDDERGSVPVWTDLMLLNGKNKSFTQQMLLHVARLFLNLHTGERSNLYSSPFPSVLHLCGLGSVHILKQGRSLGPYCLGKES